MANLTPFSLKYMYSIYTGATCQYHVPIQVTFSSPAVRGDGNHDDRQPPSSKAARLATPKHTFSSKLSPSQHGSSKVIHGQNENVCDGVKSEGVREVESEETLAQRQVEMERAAIAGLSECVYLCSSYSHLN